MATLLVAPKPFYEIQGEMAQSEQQQQAVEINKMNIEAAKQRTALEAQRKQDLINIYNQTKGSGAPVPAANVQQLAQQTQPQTQTQADTAPTDTTAAPTQAKGPDGSPMPSFMKGVTEEAAGKVEAQPTTQGQTQQPEPTKGVEEPHIVQQMTDTKKEVDGVDQAIRINTMAADKAYARGDAAYAKELMDENMRLKNNQLINQNQHLAVMQKGMEIMGQVGNGYKGSYNEWLKNNMNATPQEKQAMSDSLWAQLVTKAQMNGLPGTDLMKYQTPDQRNQYATGLIESSEKASDRIRLQLGELNANTKLQIANQRLDFDKQKEANKETMKAWQRNNGDAQTGIKLYNARISILGKELEMEKQAATLGDEKALDKKAAIEAEMDKLKSELTDVYKKNKITPPADKAPAATTDKAAPSTGASDSKTSFDPSKLPDERKQALAAYNDPSAKPEEKQAIANAFKAETGEDLLKESSDSKTSLAATQDPEQLRKEILKEVNYLKRLQGSKAILFGRPIEDVISSIKSYNESELKSISQPTVFGRKVQSSESAREERIKALLDQLEKLTPQ